MESPKTGIVLLVLVAVTTAVGGFLGWTLRTRGMPGEAVKMIRPDVPVVLPAAEVFVPPVPSTPSVVPAAGTGQ